jgi:hypothetical protein
MRKASFPAAGRTSDRAGAARFPGVIDLKGSFGRADARGFTRYLPLGIPADVRHYVRDSVLKGEVNDLLVRIKGGSERHSLRGPAIG